MGKDSSLIKFWPTMRCLSLLLCVQLVLPFELFARIPRPTVHRLPTVNAIAELIKPDVDVKPSLSDVVPDCPATIWDAEDIDVDHWQQQYANEDRPVCPVEIVATSADNAAGASYFEERAEELKAKLLTHGTIWFRGFDLMKDPEGFRLFWETLGLDPCLDPIHNSGLRKFHSKKDAVYEEVNKQALSKHYIGLHNEATEKKTATTGAFVCFKPATVSGGEFLIADGEAEAKEAAKGKVGELVDKNIATKFDMDLEMLWGTDGKEYRLQAVELAESPVNRHPVTKRPVWFCNMHNHARFLRDRRPCSVPEVGMTDVYFGDLSVIPGEMILKINEACERNIVRVPMQPGDVLLCDNYRVLHGRDIFQGERLHAVSWFGDASMTQAPGKPGDLLNSFVNNFLVGK